MMNMIRMEKAKPIWLAGLSEAMNVTAGFRTVFKAGLAGYVLRIAGSSIYRIWLNGRFVGHGPARCGHGFYRVDEWALPVAGGDNLLAIEGVGYNANSFAYLDQPAFVQAEVIGDGRVIAATGTAAFTAYRLAERIRKVQRYSFQRPFVEAYKLKPSSADWYTRLNVTKHPHAIEVLEKRQLIPRGVPYPNFETKRPVAQTASGSARPLKDPKLRWAREYVGGENYKIFPPNRQTLFPGHEIESLAFRIRSAKPRDYDPATEMTLDADQFRILDYGTNLTGFIGLRGTCDDAVDLYLVFDELAMENGDVSITRYGCANVVKYSLAPGTYALESIEPYTLKCLKLLAMKGSCRVHDVYLREYVSPDAQKGRFAASDHRLTALFEAARQTFRQNAVDLFMDCPGRERAGWLCDSFFTARTEHVLCGKNTIERNFLENYLLPESYPRLVKGMLPMCYPSDHNDGCFIPNWAMWFVIELEEFLGRSGDREMVDALKGKVYGLIDYFKAFLNEDGLLEKLESWVFLEWSKSNNFVQDVSYPSNMVYAGMLQAAGVLYDDEALKRQAAAVRGTIRQQSYDGAFFVDNAVRKDDGSLEVTRNRTETCQYYAFFFDVATPASHPELWKRLVHDFGPNRDPKTQFAEIYPSNAFIGFFLRLDVLSRYGETGAILDQLYKHYVPMAGKTGTLWEHKDTGASCNHGFASHVAHILYRDILGIRIDPVAKTVAFTMPAIALDWCEGHIPVADGWIDAKWVREGDTVTHSLSVPKGFRTHGSAMDAC